MAFRFIIIALFLNVSISFSQAQDSLVAQSNHLKDSVPLQNIHVKDSLIDKTSITLDSLSVSIDSLSIKNLKDLEIAAKYDEKWYEELYSSTYLIPYIKRLPN